MLFSKAHHAIVKVLTGTVLVAVSLVFCMNTSFAYADTETHSDPDALFGIAANTPVVHIGSSSFEEAGEQQEAIDDLPADEEAATEPDGEAAQAAPEEGAPLKGVWELTNEGWLYITDKGPVTGLHQIDGQVYLLDPTTGIMATGWRFFDGFWYYFDKRGVMQTGWIKPGATWYFLNPDGKMATGWVQDSSLLYYTNADGAMLSGWQFIDDTWYYFDRSGAMVTGWVKTGGKWYFLHTDGKMATGWVQDGAQRYYTKDDGAMVIGWLLDGDTWYYFNRSGALYSGWLKDGVWYYLDPQDECAMKTGKFFDGSAWYISNDSGAMFANRWVELPEGWYYATGSGALKTGWHKSGGKWYWLQSDHECLMLADGLSRIDNVLYSFDSTGAMYENCLVKLESNELGYADKSGAISPLGVGNIENGDLVFRDDEGNLLTGWQQLADKWFYADENGVAQTGWLSENGNSYYLGNLGAMAQNEWVKENGKWYYFGNSGAMAKSTWVQDGGKWYFLSANGEMIDRAYSHPASSSRLVSAAQSLGYQGNGYCAKWTNFVYVNAGYAHPDGNACDLYWKYCNISNLDLLEPGMIVAVPSHNKSVLGGKYGHVAIYMGDGMVRHNTSKVETVSLASWLDYYQNKYPAKCGWAFY